MIYLLKRWPLALLGLTLLAVIILTAGLNQSTLGPSEPFPVWVFNDLEPDQVRYESLPSNYRKSPSSLQIRRSLFFLFTLALFMAWFLTFILHPQSRSRMITRLIGYILILLVIGWLYDEIRPQTLPDGGGGDDVEIGVDGSFLQDTPAMPSAVAEPPQWLVIIITLTIIAAILGIGWWLWQKRTRSVEQAPAQLLAQEAQQAAKTIEAGSDLKDTVLHCYRDMSRVLSEYQQIHRDSAMTPREFETHLAETGISSDHVQRLTRLFENVRYGNNIATEREKREALDCLHSIARTYGGSA